MTKYPHPPSRYRPSEGACARCGTPLWREACGCWTDCRAKRWCDDGDELHQPETGSQPVTCGATL